MAIITLDHGDYYIEAYGQSGRTIEFVQLFGHGRGWLTAGDVPSKVCRLREVQPGEAATLCNFLMESKALSQFQHRMSPEDWDCLLNGFEEPSEFLQVKVA